MPLDQTQNNQQAHSAQTLYNTRSTTYDESWHPRFANHIIQLASPQPSTSLLDLACGTGLVTFAFANLLSPSVGTIIGIDISDGMLSQARSKLTSQQKISFYNHSITDLASLPALRDKQGYFDLITCTSALVLLPSPLAALKTWTQYLKPSGKLITDITHISNQPIGIVYERVGQRLKIPIPHHRLNFPHPSSLQNMLMEAGLQNVQIFPIAQQQIKGTEELSAYLAAGAEERVTKVYGVEEADQVFEATVDGVAWRALGEAEVRAEAKEVFREEWARIADSEGKIKDVDCVFVGIGQKSPV